MSFRSLGTYLCRACGFEWTAPYDGIKNYASRCPRCHQEQIVLKDGSVRTETAHRV